MGVTLPLVPSLFFWNPNSSGGRKKLAFKKLKKEIENGGLLRRVMIKPKVESKQKRNDTKVLYYYTNFLDDIVGKRTLCSQRNSIAWTKKE